MVETVEIKNAQLTPELAGTNTEGAEAPKEATSDRPSWLPEKFQSAEELAKAYGELEKSYSSRTENKAEDKPAMDLVREASEQKENLEKQTGLDLTPFYDEFAKDGKLADDSYKKLDGLGLDKQLVDSYINGQQALADRGVSEIQNTVGGKENYDKLVQWASENLSESEIKTFNDTIEKGTTEQAKFSIKAVHSRYQLESGVEPQLVQGTKTASGGEAFRSSAQVIEAMNDKRYETDPAFRDEVARKLKNSNVL